MLMLPIPDLFKQQTIKPLIFTNNFLMDESFELPVAFRGEVIKFPASLQSWGYSHRIMIMVEGREIIFEPDEERNYRAVVTDPQRTPDISLLRAIAESLERAFK